MERLEDMYYNSYTDEQIEQGIAQLMSEIKEYKEKAIKPKKKYRQVFNKLPINKQIFIRNLIFEGHKIYEISKNHNIRISCLINLSKENNIIASTMIIGNKTEEYATEEEMIRGYIPPTYEELSQEEKNIYNLM